MEKIAIDVGGVLIEKKEKRGPDTNFDLDDIRWMPGALEAVSRLIEHYDIFILSFCGKKTEMETRLALRKEIALYVPEYKWIFTREREYKVDRMQQYGITTLIDDTGRIIQWVQDAGLEGIHYGSERFPDWETITRYLMSRSANANSE